VGTGYYLTITVSQTQVADPNARTEPTEDEIAAKRAEIESELAKGADEETGKPVSEVAQAYIDALAEKMITLMAANLDGKTDDEIIKMVNDAEIPIPHGKCSEIKNTYMEYAFNGEQAVL